MSIQGVAVILAPNETVWHGSDHAVLLTEDGSEEMARQRLMNSFAHTLLNGVIGDIDDSDAWYLWQIAEKKGYRIKTVNSLVELLGSPK